MQPQNSICCPNEGGDVGEAVTFFLEIDLTSSDITDIVAQRSGDLQIKNFMRASARLLLCAMWPPEAHEFDTPRVVDSQPRCYAAFALKML